MHNLMEILKTTKLYPVVFAFKEETRPSDRAFAASELQGTNHGVQRSRWGLTRDGGRA